MKTLMKLLETVYAIMYFLIAIVAAIILYPISFLFSKVHHEESGYDLWNIFFTKLIMISI